MIAIKQSNSLHEIGNIKPVGDIIICTSRNLPRNYLECNGGGLYRSQYPELLSFAVNNGLIGSDQSTYLFGSGDGSSTFTLPDLRELVFVGINQNARYDISRHDVYSLGQFKDDCFQRHYHTYVRPGTETSTGRVDRNTAYLGNSSTRNTSSDHSGRNSDTTHSKQIGLIYAIKVRSI